MLEMHFNSPMDLTDFKIEVKRILLTKEKSIKLSNLLKQYLQNISLKDLLTRKLVEHRTKENYL